MVVCIVSIEKYWPSSSISVQCWPERRGWRKKRNGTSSVSPWCCVRVREMSSLGYMMLLKEEKGSLSIRTSRTNRIQIVSFVDVVLVKNQWIELIKLSTWCKTKNPSHFLVKWTHPIKLSGYDRNSREEEKRIEASAKVEMTNAHGLVFDAFPWLLKKDGCMQRTAGSRKSTANASSPHFTVRNPINLELSIENDWNSSLHLSECYRVDWRGDAQMRHWLAEGRGGQ